MPFVPGLLQYTTLAPDFLLYAPTWTTVVVYIIVVGIPVLLCLMTSDRFENPFLEYMGIYTGMVMVEVKPEYKFVLKSPVYREKFVAMNRDIQVKMGAGLSRFRIDLEMLGAGICCVGIAFPILAAVIFHLIMG